MSSQSSRSTDERTLARVEIKDGVTHITCPTNYVDGYRVTVGWSEADGSWVARCSGMKAFIPGEAIGVGDTKEESLLDLACHLAASADCLGQVIDKLEGRADAS